MAQNGMERNTFMGMQQMGPYPNHSGQPIFVTIQPPIPTTLVWMPPGSTLIPAPSISQPLPNPNLQPVYHYENIPGQEPQQQDTRQHQSGPSTSTSSVPPNSTYIRGKTPMCMVRELARYNKIQYQYLLTQETGPPHKKVFTITLKLGNEEYTSQGLSIKKAQQSAAAQSLDKTKLKHPRYKSIRSRPEPRTINSTVMPPTVELNAIAMRHGHIPEYIVENPPPPPHHSQGYINYSGYGAQNQPMFYNIPPYPFHENRYYSQCRPMGTYSLGNPHTVRLRVWGREYPGVGSTIQAARHDAAAKAIEDIKQMGYCPNETPAWGDNTQPSGVNTELKSAISVVHEIALKRNLNVTFDVLNERGPSHMRVFITQCRVGNFVTQGEGNGKKKSKQHAAEKMLEVLGKLPPLPDIHTPIVDLKRNRVSHKKRRGNLIKVNMDNTSEIANRINPISRLTRIQQANKKRKPVFIVLDNRGARRRHEFVIEASANGYSCIGVGPNKKVAKRNAAEALLNLLGYDNPPSNPNPLLTTRSRAVTFVEEEIESTLSVGDSGVPGRLLMEQQPTE